ncbi:MAG: polyprenyl synthetase family protein [Planctomycetota bacterium]
MLNLAEIDLPIAAVLDEQLEDVGLILERQLASDLSAVNALCRHAEQYHGKRLRPILVLLSGLATGPSPGDGSGLNEKHRVVAAVVEMIHMATLVHDDVLDEAQIRRQVATLNRLRGNETAVMLGDYLISNAFHLCSSLNDPAINLSLGEVTNTICEGELLQLHHRDDTDIDEPTYFEIVGRKTASLIGECCRLGAMLSGGTAAVRSSMRRFGTLLGVAFQIQDDLLDITGDEAIVGKSLGRDLDSGKVTLPLIRYLATADQAQRADVLRQFSQRNAEKLRSRLVASGAVADAQREASRLVEQAKAELSGLPMSPARDLLEALADAAVSRRS